MYCQNVGGMNNMFGFPSQFQPTYSGFMNGPFSRNTHAAQGVPWVNAEELKNVFTPPGVPVLFMDRDTNKFYIKETSKDGVSFVKTFTFNEDAEKPDNANESYITAEQFNEYMKKVDDKIESFIQHANATTNTAANESTNAATNAQSNAIPVEAYTINNNGPVIRSSEEWKSYTSQESTRSNGQVWQNNTGSTG